MIKDWSTPLSPAELRSIIGSGNDGWRRGDICHFARLLPNSMSAADAAHILEHLEGEERATAIGCLSAKSATDFGAGEALQLLGPIVTAPPTAPSVQWAHERAVCAMARNIRDDIDGDALATILGRTTGRNRWVQINCLYEKIAHGLSWADVDKVVGQTPTYRGAIVDALGDRSPDGANKLKLEALRREFNGRLLTTPDPQNNWMGGQCVAWAKMAFARISPRGLDASVGTARNILAVAASLGFQIESDPSKARVGSLAVWDNSDVSGSGSGAGHVGIVKQVVRNSDTGAITRIFVHEANWGQITENGARRWGLALDEAKRQFVTERYADVTEAILDTPELNRSGVGGTYRFVGYVHPAELGVAPGGSGSQPAPVEPPVVVSANTVPPTPTTNTPARFACTPGQRQLAADLRKAYNGNMNEIASVARDADYALLASAAYDRKPDQVMLDQLTQRGWARVGAPQVVSTGISGDMQYSVFERGTELVVAFQGTDPGSLRDWLTNTSAGSGDSSPFLGQVEVAKRVATEVASRNAGKTIVFVGHSLGGRLAQLAAFQTNRSAVVFDTSPVSRDEAAAMRERRTLDFVIRAYRGNQDVVSDLDVGQYPASQTVVRNIFDVEGGVAARLFAVGYTHSDQYLAAAMQDVRQVRDTGGFECANEAGTQGVTQ